MKNRAKRANNELAFAILFPGLITVTVGLMWLWATKLLADDPLHLQRWSNTSESIIAVGISGILLVILIAYWETLQQYDLYLRQERCWWREHHRRFHLIRERLLAEDESSRVAIAV